MDKAKRQRCGERHPLYQQVRCEESRGHDAQHFNSFFMRAWDVEPVRAKVRAS